MKKFSVIVEYNFEAQITVEAENRQDAFNIVHEKIKVVAGIRQNDVRIKEKFMPSGPTETQITNIREL